jgi:dihydroxyacetone kinase-like predicted kinase
MLAYLPGGDAEATVAAMTAAAADVTAGEVTMAVRDATTPAGSIAEGDWLGIVSGDVEVIAADCADAAWQVLDRMVGGDSEVVMIITGNDADETITDVITSRFSVAHPEVSVEVVSGEQPLYPYLFGVE